MTPTPPDPAKAAGPAPAQGKPGQSSFHCAAADAENAEVTDAWTR